MFIRCKVVKKIPSMLEKKLFQDEESKQGHENPAFVPDKNKTTSSTSTINTINSVKSSPGSFEATTES